MVVIVNTAAKPSITACLAARQPDGKRPVVMYHTWESLLFLHWPIAADRIQETLPAGVSVDTYNDQAYLGLTPFFMRNVRPVGLPSLPWFSSFQELNVRTYVFDETGVPGIWFYSLDCNQPLAVTGARAFTGLPYFNAHMDSVTSEFIDYTCQRHGTDEVARYRYRGIGDSQESSPGSFEFFLLERYYLFSTRRRTLIREQVSHVPYRYRIAEVETYSTSPAQLDGFADVSGPPVHACFVDGLDVKVYGTQLLRR